MKYMIIAGEASGDLHGAELINALRSTDAEAQFRFLGGDLMSNAAGASPLVHYREMAHMGFIDVIRHLRPILGFLRTARDEVRRWHPDALVLIDYPSFNLKMARYAHSLGIPTVYFISPKVWVWKQWRVKAIKRDVDEMCCILPFEPTFYSRHGYQATYVGNPTVGELTRAIASMPERDRFCLNHSLDASRHIIALVPGSRVKEIRDNLPSMLEAARRHPDCLPVIAAAPGIDHNVYRDVMGDTGITIVENDTWALVRHSRVALVTSGTATLETAILGTPQVACYRMNGSKWLYSFYRRLLKGNYVTLPNLIADRAIIPELLIHHCSPHNIDSHLTALLADSEERSRQLRGYEEVMELLGSADCAVNTAHHIIKLINSTGKQ